MYIQLSLCARAKAATGVVRNFKLFGGGVDGSAILTPLRCTFSRFCLRVARSFRS